MTLAAIEAASTNAAETAAPAAKTAARAAKTAARAALFARLGLGFVDANGATVEFMAVQRVDRGLCLSGIGHRDEAKPLAATGHAIGYNANSGNFAVCRERRLETFVGGRVREVTNIDFHLLYFLVSF